MSIEQEPKEREKFLNDYFGFDKIEVKTE